MNYLAYTPEGRIFKWGIGTQIPENTPEYVWVEHNLDWPPAYFWDGNSFQLRVYLGGTWDKTEIVADGVDEATLSPLPDCTVYVDEVPYPVTTGSFSLSALTPGVYEVRVSEVGYIGERWEIVAG